MQPRPRIIAGSAIAAIATVLVAETVQAATWAPVVSPSVAKAGDEITLSISAFGGPATYGTDVYMIPSATFADGPPCTAMSGAVKVGSLVWTIDGLNHAGVAHFTVPDLPDGEYSLGVDMTPFGCMFSLTLRVDSEMADTAFRRGSSTSGWLFIAGLMLIGAAALLWPPRAGSRRR